MAAQHFVCAALWLMVAEEWGYGGGSQMLAVSTDIRSDYVALGRFLPRASSEVLVLEERS